MPGPIEPAFAIQDLHLVSDANWSGFEATIANTGNVLVKPTGKLTVSDLQGNPLTSQDVTLGTYYAFKSGLMQVGFASQLPAGDYLVTLIAEPRHLCYRDHLESADRNDDPRRDRCRVAFPPVSFSVATAAIKPDTKSPQFLDIAATISNTGEPVSDAELSLVPGRTASSSKTTWWSRRSHCRLAIPRSNPATFRSTGGRADDRLSPFECARSRSEHRSRYRFEHHQTR